MKYICITRSIKIFPIRLYGFTKSNRLSEINKLCWSFSIVRIYKIFLPQKVVPHLSFFLHAVSKTSSRSFPTIRCFLSIVALKGLSVVVVSLSARASGSLVALINGLFQHCSNFSEIKKLVWYRFSIAWTEINRVKIVAVFCVNDQHRFI